jgi:hypothetical protein
MKSTYGAGTRYVEKDGPKAEHVAQVALYTYFSPIKRFLLYYVSRDDGYDCVFSIVRTEDQFRVNGTSSDDPVPAILARWAYVEEAVALHSIPRRDHRAAIKDGVIRDYYQCNNVKYKTDWQCSYCAYKTTCWKKELEKHAQGNNAEDFKEVKHGQA